jgi:hypothetical protein
MPEERPLREQRDLEEFVRLSELFKFYLELVLKVFIATLGIAGGVTTFALKKGDVLDTKISSLGLFLPAALCLGVGIGFFVALRSSFQIGEALDELKVLLKLRVAPHSANLWLSPIGFGVLLTICGGGLLGLSLALYFGWHP